MSYSISDTAAETSSSSSCSKETVSQCPSIGIRASNEVSRIFHNLGEGPYYGLLLVKSAYY